MRYTGLAFRAHNPAWSFSPVSGEGAKRHGGRFNPKGLPALYLSLSETTALAEYNQGFPHRPQPSTLCAYQIDCDRLMNLCNEEERALANITLNEMACAWEFMSKRGQIPPTWDLAKRLVKEDWAGILVPSYAKNAPSEGVNLVLWQWGDTLPHQVIVIDDKDRLPKNQNSWR